MRQSHTEAPVEHRVTRAIATVTICCGAFFALALALPANALISDGANAVDVLGQMDADVTSSVTAIYAKGNLDDSPNRTGLNGARDVAIDTVNHRLYATDYNNNRVYVYALNTDNTLPDRVPDFILGQTSFNNNAVATTQSGLKTPNGLAVDTVNNRLFVAEEGNHRVVVYDVATITNGESAVNVLGQANFTSGTAALSQSRMNAPRHMAYDSANSRLFVADVVNNRVLVFDVASITNGENAVNVLGQANFTSNGTGATQSGMNLPSGLAYDAANSRLYVAEDGNNRVTVFDAAAITDGENAVNVLGQANFTSSNSATTIEGMYRPFDLALDAANNRLFVSSLSSHRVTVYDVAAITDGENATGVLGQPDFIGSSSALTQAGMNMPNGLSYDAGNTRLYVAEEANNRITAFDVAIINNGENAVDALGQYDADSASLTAPTPLYTKGAAADAPNRIGYNQPMGVAVDAVNNRMYVTDSSNHRVLVYNLNADDTLPDRVPDFVLGQPNFNTKTSALTQSGMNTPFAVAVDSSGNRLFVSEFNNNRVLVFDVASITNGENAVNVLGKANFTTNLASATQSGMNNAAGLVYDSANSRLIVADSSNRRVLFYDVASITNGENAVNVLGQANFTSSTFATTQSGFGNTVDVLLDSSANRLYVSDFNNHRVMIFDVASITDGENAVNVLGQTDYVTATSGVTQAKMNFPYGLAMDASTNRLFVADSTNHRVLVFDVASMTDGENAVNVLGQSNFTASTFGTTQSKFKGPRFLSYVSSTKRLYVAERDNRRVTAFDAEGAATVSSGGGRPAETIPAIVTLSQPNGGQQWTVGSTQWIFWSVTGGEPHTITIELSVDGGATYPTIIATGEVADGAYSWTVPDMATMQARIRVKSVLSDGTVRSEDASDANFIIAAQTPAPPLPPAPAPPEEKKKTCEDLGKATICHFHSAMKPPLTLCVAEESVAKHISQHGDHRGECMPSEEKVDVCGNGLCELSESSAACAVDCPAPPPLLACSELQCTKPEALCIAYCPVKDPEPACGNELCEVGESVASCPSDCKVPSPPAGPVCGNALCEVGEWAETCPLDCLVPPPPAGPVCGDNRCEIPEDSARCPIDCPAPAPPSGPTCGNRLCEIGEAPNICPADCKVSPPPPGPTCGNRLCELGEGALDCPADCAPPMLPPGPVCGDAKCADDETALSCAADCPVPPVAEGPVCGNQACETGETWRSCPVDCRVSGGGGGGPACGNALCETGESIISCPTDCKVAPLPPEKPACGDNICGAKETTASCPIDCPAVPAEKACTPDCNNVTYDLYIVNPDGTKRFMSGPFARVSDVGPTRKIISFEDKGADNDFDDVVLSVDRTDCTRITVSALSIDAAWAHNVRMRILFKGVAVRDVLVWKDSHLGIGGRGYVNANDGQMTCEERPLVLTYDLPDASYGEETVETKVVDDSGAKNEYTEDERNAPVTDPTAEGPFGPDAARDATLTINVDKSIPPTNLPPTTACVSGRLVKGTSFDAVYYCGADGRRYVFPNVGTYFSWYPGFDKVIEIPDAELAKIPLGRNVTYRPGMRMIKIVTDPMTYVVTRGGVLRAIASEALAAALYGASWMSLVHDVDVAFWTNYVIGKPIAE